MSPGPLTHLGKGEGDRGSWRGLGSQSSHSGVIKTTPTPRHPAPTDQGLGHSLGIVGYFSAHVAVLTKPMGFH
jgi:hypothetical protein